MEDSSTAKTPMPTATKLDKDETGKKVDITGYREGAGPDETEDDISESFSFALLNGALGVFEVQGQRIRDFRPKWPSSSFALSDGLVTTMAYDLPHVVMGDRLQPALFYTCY
ncbi:hypothetical protein POM88_045332 [Heracleum sosnowskyi]|uniref:WDR11 second beta-propeller domain-containing protein n=1 Tax=Heracleum sosnowskyi TaxID=360622 RepID=A0AAD8M6B4_9APIA|nr:hypothetical protein POM88_045332 [Heracleum sosnowskyi]